MRPTQFSANTISALLGNQTIASLAEVMAALGAGASRRTAFRKLKDIDARTSYSHRGGYYTLDQLADFDERVLVADERLTRHKLAGQFLYCAADRAQQTHQVRSRRLLLATPGLGQPLPDADLIPEELRAAIVLFASLLDERQRRLFAGLEALKCGWGGDRRIARLLGIDPSTVASGRRLADARRQAPAGVARSVW